MKHTHLILFLLLTTAFWANGLDADTLNIQPVSYQAVPLPSSLLAPGLEASGINNAGVVVGDFPLPRDEGGGVEGFTYDLNTGVPTTFALPNNEVGRDYRINDSGVIIGTIGSNIQTGLEGFIGHPEAFTPLMFPGSVSTQLYAINDAGAVVGNYFDSSKMSHGFIYQNGTFQTLDAGANTALTGINNVGQIVGVVGLDSSSQYSYAGAFLYSDGAFTTQSILGEPSAINDFGLITLINGIHGAGLYNLNTEAYFNNLGFFPPFGLNNSGDIVAQDAFVYTPTPEAASVFLVIPGCLLLFGFRNRRMRVNS